MDSSYFTPIFSLWRIATCFWFNGWERAGRYIPFTPVILATSLNSSTGIGFTKNAGTPSSSANVNKDFHIYVTFTESSHDNVYFKDENDNVINPTSEVTTRKNGKYFTDYTVKFSKEGSYKLTPCYIYHSGEVQVRDNILNVNVFSENYYGGSYLISDTDVNLGDTFTIKQYVPAKMHYYYYDSEGNELTPVSYDYKYESTGTYAYITFRTTKLGLNQKFTCKASHAYAPYGRMDVNQEIAINVWKNI